jgi:two-component system cell cycle sensor histidine kinase/response regulator CckA
VRADRGQIEQVLMNLVLNARDAMPDGGKLTIETQRAQIDDEYAAQHACDRSGEFVLLAVSDTGVGMTDEVKTHVFEPFYTSKEVGKGTGLGLATIYGIVKQSGGFIWIYSEPGHGATFKVFLPSVAGQADGPVEVAQPAEIPRATETVLLVEDEPALREVAARGLRDQGYRVLVAALGVEALRVAERYEGEIHLLVTDVVMPGMSGPKLAERIRATRPSAKVLFTSGYTDAAFDGQGIAAPRDLLQKPFTIAALARKAHETLRP